MEIRKVLLTEDEIPRQWYNLLADIKLNPPLGPDGKPVTPDMLSPVFPMNLIEQEVSTQRWIDIPEEILGVYRPGSITKTKASVRQAATNPTQPYLRHIITRCSASKK